MIISTNPLAVKIFINSTLTGEENGWAEHWPILETDWNLALPIALALVKARQQVLSSNAYIQWGCLASVAPPYFEQTVVTEPLYPLPQWGQAAFDMQGLLFGFTTESGWNSRHIFRAVEADSINDKQWMFRDVDFPMAAPALPADLNTAPKELLWQNTIATFSNYICRCTPPTAEYAGNPDGYVVEPFYVGFFSQVSSRFWGRPWKRLSWEAAPFVNAPQFSPCGCVVTVDRISYAAPCRFGNGWSDRWIHYYEARPNATVMTYKTPFCAWNRSKEYTDFSGVGEAHKFVKRYWTNGESWGNAPGVMWTGPQAYFEGLAPEPSTPTPPAILPGCDYPVAPPGQVAQGGAGLGGAGITCSVVSETPVVPVWVDRDRGERNMILQWERKPRLRPGGRRLVVTCPPSPPSSPLWVPNRTMTLGKVVLPDEYREVIMHEPPVAKCANLSPPAGPVYVRQLQTGYFPTGLNSTRSWQEQTLEGSALLFFWGSSLDQLVTIPLASSFFGDITTSLLLANNSCIISASPEDGVTVTSGDSSGVTWTMLELVGLSVPSVLQSTMAAVDVTGTSFVVPTITPVAGADILFLMVLSDVPVSGFGEAWTVANWDVNAGTCHLTVLYQLLNGDTVSASTITFGNAARTTIGMFSVGS